MSIGLDGVERIKSCLRAGGSVMLTTYAGGRMFEKESDAERFFTSTRGEAWLRTGNRRVCIEGCGVRFGRIKAAA